VAGGIYNTHVQAWAKAVCKLDCMQPLMHLTDITLTVLAGPFVLDQGTLMVSPSRPSTRLHTMCLGFCTLYAVTTSPTVGKVSKSSTCKSLCRCLYAAQEDNIDLPTLMILAKTEKCSSKMRSPLMLKNGSENGSSGVSPLLLSVGNMLGPVHCRAQVVHSKRCMPDDACNPKRFSAEQSQQ